MITLMMSGLVNSHAKLTKSEICLDLTNESTLALEIRNCAIHLNCFV
jgi:hypothetical protein